MTLWWGRKFQGGRNSGRAVARMSRGAWAPRSLSGPELRPLYPSHWRELSSHVRFERGRVAQTNQGLGACLDNSGLWWRRLLENQILFAYEQDLPALDNRSAAVVAAERSGLCRRGPSGSLRR